MIQKILVLFFAATLSLVVCDAVAADERPNILFLFADDQRADTIAAWGNEHITTPNLDALAKRGMSFRSNYNLGGSNGAVCIASRAMVNSGRAWTHSPDDLKNVRTFPEIFRDAGYQTFLTGKWHNGNESCLRSFESGKHVFLGGMCDHTNVTTHTLTNQRLEKNPPNKSFSSELFTGAIIDFLHERDRQRPFYAALCFTAPHDPRQPPESYRNHYYNALPPLPHNFLPQHPFNNGELVLRDEQLAAWPRDEKVVQQQLAEYYGMITHLDEQLGKVLKTLDDLKLSDNTIIVYAADHGLALGSHGLLGKQSMYEHSIRCPLIFAGPGIRPGQTTNSMTYLLDVGPTLLELTNVDSQESLDGKSLKPILADANASVRSEMGFAYSKLMRAFRDERWKLIVYPPFNRKQLFDLQLDPDERTDLSELPEHQQRIADLTAKMQHWQASVGDSLELTTNAPRSSEIDLTGHKRSRDNWQPAWIVEKYFK